MSSSAGKPAARVSNALNPIPFSIGKRGKNVNDVKVSNTRTVKVSNTRTIRQKGHTVDLKEFIIVEPQF